MNKRKAIVVRLRCPKKTAEFFRIAVGHRPTSLGEAVKQFRLREYPILLRDLVKFLKRQRVKSEKVAQLPLPDGVFLFPKSGDIKFRRTRQPGKNSGPANGVRG